MNMKISTPRPPSAPATTPTGVRPQQDNPGLEDDAALFRQSLDENRTASEGQPEARRAGAERGAAARYQPEPTGARPHLRHGGAPHHRDHGTAGAHARGTAGAHAPGATEAPERAADGARARAATGANKHGTAGLHEHAAAEGGQHEIAGTPRHELAGTHPRTTAGTPRHEPGTGVTDAGTHEPGLQGTQSHQSGLADAAQQQPKPAPGTDPAGAAAPDDAASPAQTEDKDTAATTEPGQDLYQLLAAQEARSHEIATQKAAQVAAPTISPELVDKVAERILVTVNNLDQNKEVRILVKDTVLQNTEVALKYEEGRLVVNFMTQSAADNSLLTNNSQTLKESLQQALGGEVRVDVNADTGDADPRRHSKGLYLDDEQDNA
ncbi:MAG: hypothetical protein OXD47_00175 [Gammaproteobacteria bacterium]|nr:hypothetical protein [Gammaproteobacteria bacterium]